MRIVDPPGDLLAQPVQPERLNIIKRFLSCEREGCLSKISPPAPNRRQKVVSTLKRSVIKTVMRTPFWVSGIVQKGSSKLCVPVACTNDDPKRFGIHVVLFPGHFHVLVTFKTGSDVHAIPPARSENVGQDHRRAPADLRLARRRFGIMALSGTRIFS